MQNQNIDSGTVFDRGRTSDDYAKFRDIYPLAFYEKILERNCGTAGQQVLDIGTGTGVLPRNLYAAGAHWTGSDIAPNQIAQAKACSAGMDIAYLVSAAEDLDLPAGSFDCVTACQCYWYLTTPELHRYFPTCSSRMAKCCFCAWNGCLMRTRSLRQVKIWFCSTIQSGAAQEKPCTPLQLHRNYWNTST